MNCRRFRRINGIIGVRYWRNLNFAPDRGSRARRYIRARARTRGGAHVYAYVTVDSYVYVFMPRVPVDLITTIGLTNLIDVHQLFGPRSKAV